MKTFLFLCLAPIVTTAVESNPKEDEKALHAIVHTLETGWNQRSGQTFASVFAEQHDYVVVNGLYLANQSKQNNAYAHQGIFDSVYKTTDLRLKVDKIKFLRDDLALIHALGATYEHGSAIPENPKVIISMLAEKRGNTWEIISFHNCDIEISFDPSQPSGSRIPPQVMYASWYAE